MKDFITEAWLRANHTLSEGAEIHLPADSRLTPSARELLESRHLRIKFIDEQGRLFVDDEQQQPQPVHGLTSSDEHPQACCELCRQPVAKKPDTLTHLSAEKMVAKSDPRLGFRAVLDSTIALAVWLQIELAEPWQPWLADIRSRLGNIMRADALGEPLGCQAIVGLSDSASAFSSAAALSRPRSSGAGSQPRARCCVAQSATHQSAGNRNRSGAGLYHPQL